MLNIPNTLPMLELFAGIGGFSLAGKWLGIQTTQFVELSPLAQEALSDRFPYVPIHGDIRTFKGEANQFGIITAGFPCTGTSEAGNREGLLHPDSYLFMEALRIINEIKPKYAVIEQPVGIIHRGLRSVLGGLRMVGYSSWIISVTARSLGAGHKRERIFVVSHPHSGSGDPTIQLSGASEVRTLVSAARNYANWLQVVPRSDGSNHGVSVRMVTGSMFKRSHPRIAIPQGLKNRTKTRVLLGRSVTPQQAYIPLLKIHLMEKQKCLNKQILIPQHSTLKR